MSDRCPQHDLWLVDIPPFVGHACNKCVAHEIASRARNARRYFERLKNELPHHELRKLCENLSGELSKPNEDWMAMALLGRLVRFSQCMRHDTLFVLEHLIKTRSIDVLFPNPVKDRIIAQAIRAQYL